MSQKTTKAAPPRKANRFTSALLLYPFFTTFLFSNLHKKQAIFLCIEKLVTSRLSLRVIFDRKLYREVVLSQELSRCLYIIYSLFLFCIAQKRNKKTRLFEKNQKILRNPQPQMKNNSSRKSVTQTDFHLFSQAASLIFNFFSIGRFSLYRET